MANKRHKYDKDSDTLWVSVDESEMGEKQNPVCVIRGFVYFNINPKTGALRTFEIKNISKIVNEKTPNKRIIYSDYVELQINLNKPYEKIGCDLVYADLDNQAMITLDRNEVGNLQGLEILNLQYFLS